MRELVSISDDQQARRFAAYLAVQGVESTVENDQGEWVIWIHNDDDRDQAAEILTEFRQNPDDERYENAERKVRHILKEADRLRRQNHKKQADLKKRWDGSWWHCWPATYIMIGVCIAVSLICSDWGNIQMSPFGVPRLCNKTDSVLLEKLFLFGNSSAVRLDECLRREDFRIRADQQRQEQQGLRPQAPTFVEVKLIRAKCALEAAIPVFRAGEVWRLVTPIFIHLDCLHILFNMMWLRAMGTGIEFVRGTRRFVLLCLVLAVLSNLTQLLWAGPAFGGMSGVVFGLIGYVWMKGKTQPHLGLALMQQTVVYSVLWLVLCMTGAFGPIANAAHLGGFVVGIVIGARQAIWKKMPFTR